MPLKIKIDTYNIKEDTDLHVVSTYAVTKPKKKEKNNSMFIPIAFDPVCF